MATYNPKQQKAAALFHKKMVAYIDEYREHLFFVQTDTFATNRLVILHEFVNYLWGYHLITELDQIAVRIANSKFLAKLYSQNEEVPFSKDTIKGFLKDFFIFLYGKHGIKNDRIMKGFDR